MLLLTQHKACRFVSLDPEPELLRSVHVWEPANERQSVGWPVMTQWALEHTTGEAKYCTDMSHIKGNCLKPYVWQYPCHSVYINT